MIVFDEYAPGGPLGQINAQFTQTNASLSSPSGRSRGSVFGASLESNAWNAPNWTTGGWVAWLRRYAKGAIDLPVSRLFATFGKHSSDLITLWLPALLAAKPAWCFVDVFNNDFRTAGFPLSQSVTNAQTIIAALQGAGIYPIIVPCRVMGAPAAWSGTTLLQLCNFNQWLKSYCENNTGITYWDINPATVDFSTGNALANLVQSDGIHDSTQGAQLKGLAAWNLLSSVLPTRDNRFTMIGDTYDATNNPGGNLLTNGLLAGTGGTITGSTVSTGQLAQGWTIQGGTTNTPAASKTAYGSGFTNLFKQTIAFSGTGDGGNYQIFQSIPGANWAVGDTVTAEVEADWNITSGSVTGIYCQIISNGSVSNVGSDGVPGGFGDYTIAAGQSILLRTDPGVISSGTTQLFFVCGVQIGGLAMGATINFARASARKLTGLAGY